MGWALGSAPDERLVRRFVEVKGCGSEKGSVWLEGEELDSARRHHDLYYLCRVCQKADRMFEVAILNDPLSSSPKRAYEVDLFRAAKAIRCEVVTIQD